jgi:hypothetical protein
MWRLHAAASGGGTLTIVRRLKYNHDPRRTAARAFQAALKRGQRKCRASGPDQGGEVELHSTPDSRA